jgi:transglutaminase-like putative cysteine protease
MNFSIRYLTEYRHDAPVTDNLNALRVKPATNQHQRVDDFGVRVEPEARLQQHLDYYGTTVIEFGIHAWVEALLPCPGEAEPVWVGVDPTNRVFRGAATSDLDVTVKMQRLT